MKKVFACLLCCMMVIGLLSIDTTSVYANAFDDAVDYEWGHEYTGSGSCTKYYKFELQEKSLLNVTFLEKHGYSGYSFSVYDSSGKRIIEENDFVGESNTLTGMCSHATNRVLDEGCYFFYCKLPYEGTYSLMMTSEPVLNLRKAKTDSVKSSAAGKLTITASTKDSDVTGFEIQYATKSDFSNARTIEAEDATTTISGLEKGKKYYVRSRAYAIYGNGMYVYSAWSTVKSRTTKK